LFKYVSWQLLKNFPEVRNLYFYFSLLKALLKI